MTEKEAKLSKGNPAEAAGITQRKRDRNLYKIVPVRLPEDKWDQFRKEADDLGIGSSTLARIWILDALRKLDCYGQDEDKAPSEARKAKSAGSRKEAINGD